MIANFFRRIMFGIIKVLADIVDTVISLMRMLLGLDPINGGETENMLLDALTSEGVQIAFWTVLALGFICTFIFAIIRIMRNYFNDEQDDGTISKQKALVQILKSIINMVIMPVFCIALILGTTATAKVIDNATKNNYASYGTEVIFSIVTYDMLEGEWKDNYVGVGDYSGTDWQSKLTADNCKKLILIPANSSIEKQLREQTADNSLPQNVSIDLLKPLQGMDAVKYKWENKPYYQMKTHTSTEGVFVPRDGNCGYGDFQQAVDEGAYFDSFLLPLLGSAIMVCTLGMSVVVVGQRIFNCAFLYIISPFIISTRPLDDGARYKKWCEIFLSKLIGAFAIIICLNVFFLLSTKLASFTYFDGGFANGVAKIVIYIAGTLSATGASQLVANLIGADAGQSERDNATHAFRAMAPGAALAVGAVKGAGKLAGRFFGGKKDTPLSQGQMQQMMSNMGQGSALGNNASSFSAGANQSMAGTIGNALLGRTSVKDVAKRTGSAIANSRVAQIGKGAGLLALGVALAPARLAKKTAKAMGSVKNGSQTKYAQKHPNSNIAKKLDKKQMQNSLLGNKANNIKNGFINNDKKK